MSDVTDRLLSGDRTRSESVTARVIEKPTRTSLDDLVDEAGHLRNRSRLLNDDIAEVHNHALDVQLQARTDEAAKRSVIDLLSELADLGLSWRDIARLVGVSVPALRKWRQEHNEGTAEMSELTVSMNESIGTVMDEQTTRLIRRQGWFVSTKKS